MNAALMISRPVKERILPVIDANDTELPTPKDRTADVGRLVREVHYKTDDKGRHIKGVDGKIHRKSASQSRSYRHQSTFTYATTGIIQYVSATTAKGENGSL
jgi:hypothetical protein